MKLPKIFNKESSLGIWFVFVSRNWNQGLELGIREIDGGELLVIEEKDEMGLLVIGFGIGYRRN